MRKLFYIMISLFISSCSSNKKILNENEFTEKYLESISKKHPNVNYKIIKPLILEATYDENGEITHFLENSYREYKLEPKMLKDVIKRYTNATSNLYIEKEKINAQKIVPIIKPKDYFEQLERLGSQKADFKTPELVWESYNEDLIIVYAEDKKEKINYFNKQQFEELKISKDTLFNYAVNNLIKLIPEFQKVGGDGSFGIIAGGDYEASTLLMESIWTEENFDVDGDIIVAIPNRDIVFITGSNDKEAIKKLKPIIEESYETGNHSISKNFYKWNGRKFNKM